MDRHRLYFWLVLTVVSGALAIATVAAPRWIEHLTEFEPDRGTGIIEWALTGVFMLVTWIAALSARKAYRRLGARRDR